MLLLLKDDTGFVAPMRSGHVLLARGRRGRTGASRSSRRLGARERNPKNTVEHNARDDLTARRR